MFVLVVCLYIVYFGLFFCVKKVYTIKRSLVLNQTNERDWSFVIIRIDIELEERSVSTRQTVPRFFGMV